MDYEQIGTAYSVVQAAHLAVQLPSDSRVKLAIEPKLAWDIDHQLLARIEFWLHMLCYRDSKDAKHKRNVPELFNPFDKETKKKEPTVAVTREELKKLFNH